MNKIIGILGGMGPMATAVPPGGTLILNADDNNIKKISLDSFQGNIVYFGLSNQAHFRAKNIR